MIWLRELCYLQDYLKLFEIQQDVKNEWKKIDNDIF